MKVLNSLNMAFIVSIATCSCSGSNFSGTTTKNGGIPVAATDQTNTNSDDGASKSPEASTNTTSTSDSSGSNDESKQSSQSVSTESCKAKNSVASLEPALLASLTQGVTVSGRTFKAVVANGGIAVMNSADARQACIAAGSDLPRPDYLIQLAHQVRSQLIAPPSDTQIAAWSLPATATVTFSAINLFDDRSVDSCANHLVICQK